jgi:hypothetical protein
MQEERVWLLINGTRGVRQGAATAARQDDQDGGARPAWKRRGLLKWRDIG